MLCELPGSDMGPGLRLGLCSSFPVSGSNLQQGQVNMLELDNPCAGYDTCAGGL